jgi:hypothetical protein
MNYLIFGESRSGKSYLIGRLLQLRKKALDLEVFVPDNFNEEMDKVRANLKFTLKLLANLRSDNIVGAACLDPKEDYLGWVKIHLNEHNREQVFFALSKGETLGFADLMKGECDCGYHLYYQKDDLRGDLVCPKCKKPIYCIRPFVVIRCG